MLLMDPLWAQPLEVPQVLLMELQEAAATQLEETMEAVVLLMAAVDYQAAVDCQAAVDYQAPMEHQDMEPVPQVPSELVEQLEPPEPLELLEQLDPLLEYQAVALAHPFLLLDLEAPADSPHQDTNSKPRSFEQS